MEPNESKLTILIFNDKKIRNNLQQYIVKNGSSIGFTFKYNKKNYIFKNENSIDKLAIRFTKLKQKLIKLCL